MTVTRIEYGDAPQQFGDLWLPDEPPARCRSSCSCTAASGGRSTGST